MASFSHLLPPKLQRMIPRQTGVSCPVFYHAPKSSDYLGRVSKAIKKIPYVKLHFRQDKLDVRGNVLMKCSRNNESVHNL